VGATSGDLDFDLNSVEDFKTETQMPCEDKRKSEVMVGSLAENSTIQTKDSDLTPRVSEDKNN
jgi:predicted nuclease of predicted toxin-antitoxin system